MIKQLKLWFAALALCALTFSACKKDDQSGEGTKSISFKLKVDQSLTAFSTLAIPAITWTYAVVDLNHFEYEMKKDGVVQYSGEDGPVRNFDMLNSGDPFISITFPRLIKFDEVTAKLEIAPSGTKVPLTLKALVSSPSGNQIPVEFYFNDPATLDIHVDNIDVGRHNYVAVIVFQVNKLLSAVDLSKLATATRTDGKVIISKDSNVELYNQASAALNDSYDVTIE